MSENSSMPHVRVEYIIDKNCNNNNKERINI